MTQSAEKVLDHATLFRGEEYTEMFARRAAKGQCVNQPYLGCREFAADFQLVADPAAERPAIDETRDLGWMLHDLDFTNPSDPQPHFFRAEMKNGAIPVPNLDTGEVKSGQLFGTKEELRGNYTDNLQSPSPFLYLSHPSSL